MDNLENGTKTNHFNLNKSDHRETEKRKKKKTKLTANYKSI